MEKTNEILTASISLIIQINQQNFEQLHFIDMTDISLKFSLLRAKTR